MEQVLQLVVDNQDQVVVEQDLDQDNQLHQEQLILVEVVVQGLELLLEVVALAVQV